MPHSRIRHLFPVLLAFAALLPACNVDEPATFVPRSGTWTFTPDELVSDNCNALLIEPVPMTTFLLDYDEGDEFQIEQGDQEDIHCEIDGTTFTCGAVVIEGDPLDGFDAMINYSVVFSGEFLSTTEAEGHRVSNYTCVGEDCTLIDMVPCTRDRTYTAEFME